MAFSGVPIIPITVAWVQAGPYSSAIGEDAGFAAFAAVYLVIMGFIAGGLASIAGYFARRYVSWETLPAK